MPLRLAVAVALSWLPIACGGATAPGDKADSGTTPGDAAAPSDDADDQASLDAAELPDVATPLEAGPSCDQDAALPALGACCSTDLECGMVLGCCYNGACIYCGIR